jgi:hypothetical protein
MLLGFVLIMNILEVCSFVRGGCGELYIAGCEILSGGVARTIYSGFLRKIVWVCIIYRFVGWFFLEGAVGSMRGGVGFVGYG